MNAEDCEILKKAGIECPYKFVSADDNATTGKSKKNDVTKEAGAKPWMYGVGSAALIVVVVVLLSCFVLKRRQKKKVGLVFERTTMLASIVGTLD